MNNRMLLLLLAAGSVGVHSCSSSVCKYTIDEHPVAPTNNRYIGDWKLVEDPDKQNFIRLQDHNKPTSYHAQIWDHSGTNRTYEFTLFFSDVDSYRYINVMDWMDKDAMKQIRYHLLKIVHVSQADYSITAVAAADPALAMAENSAQVRAIIAKSAGNAAYYRDTVHLYKVR